MSSLHSTLMIAVVAIAALFVLRIFFAIQNALRTLSDIPGRQIIWLYPNRALAAFLASFYPGPGRLGHLHSRFDLYKQYGSTILSSVVLWQAIPVFWIADADAIQIMNANRHAFGKDTEGLEMVNLFGPNVLSADGPLWRHYRNVAKPAFSESNLALVWSKSVRIVTEWFAYLQKLQKPGDDSITLELSPEFDRLVVSVFLSAAYGVDVNSINFPSTREAAYSHHPSRLTMLLRQATESLFLYAFFPTALATFSSYVPIPFVSRFIRETNDIRAQLKRDTLNLINEARNTAAVVDSNLRRNASLLHTLVLANMHEDKQLTDEELLSNVFVFYLGGYDTLSPTLSLAVVMLAFYPDIQRKLYEEVRSVWPNGSPAMGAPSSYKEDFNKLTYTQAVCRETLRLNPVVVIMDRPALQDYTLPAKRFVPNSSPTNGGQKMFEEIEVHIPKGSPVIIEFEAVHNNPIHWGEDAAEFKPERFIDTENYRWPRHAFLAFSSGPRQCPGTRFALIEAVTLLANIAYSYEAALAPEYEKELKNMEARGVGVVERMRWLCDFSHTLTRRPRRTRVRMRRRAEC